GTRIIDAAMLDGLLVVDANHRVMLASRAFRDLFGLAETVPSVPLLEIVRVPEVDRLISQTLESGEPQRQELELIESPNRTARFMQLSAVATRTDAGEITGAVVL